MNIIIEVEVDQYENGDLFIELPDKVLNLLSLKESDKILWTDLKNGSWSIVKK